MLFRFVVHVAAYGVSLVCCLCQRFSATVIRSFCGVVVSVRLLSRNVKIKIYRNIILPVVLYGCVTWSLTLREERQLRVFENMVLRRIFGPRRDEVTGE